MALSSLNRLSALGLSELNTFPCLLVTVKRTDVAFREVFNCLFELSGIMHTSTRQIDMNVLVSLLKRHYKTRKMPFQHTLRLALSQIKSLNRRMLVVHF